MSIAVFIYQTSHHHHRRPDFFALLFISCRHLLRFVGVHLLTPTAPADWEMPAKMRFHSGTRRCWSFSFKELCTVIVASLSENSIFLFGLFPLSGYFRASCVCDNLKIEVWRKSSADCSHLLNMMAVFKLSHHHNCGLRESGAELEQTAVANDERYLPPKVAAVRWIRPQTVA